MPHKNTFDKSCEHTSERNIPITSSTVSFEHPTWTSEVGNKLVMFLSFIADIISCWWKHALVSDKAKIYSCTSKSGHIKVSSIPSSLALKVV